MGRLSLACVPNIPWTLDIKPIGPFKVMLRRDRRFWLRHPLMHERFMLGLLQRFIRPGDVVYDIGANLGMYARFEVTAFGAARVIAFEPMSANRALFQQNMKLGGIADRVQVFPHALADAEGHELLQIDDVASGAAALDRVTGGRASESHRQYGVPARTERVPVARLDDLVRREALPPPSVIKIDVEGAEALVLKGARQTIIQHKPRLAIELHGPDTARAVLPLLYDMGLTVFGLWNETSGQNYKPTAVDAADGLDDPYALHFLAAAADPADVSGPTPPYAGG